MKFYLMAAAASMVLMTACSGAKEKAAEAVDTVTEAISVDNDDVVYAGILPAADAAGVQYTLTLDYDTDNGSVAGEYDLTETYLEADSTTTTGYKDLQSFTSEGNFTVEDATPATNGKKYLKLVQKSDDPANASVLYFLIDSDNSIVLVGEDLQPSVNPDLNYTLTIQK